MHVTFVDNQQYFDNAYLQGEDTSRLEDKWDWDVEKELKKGTNIIVAEKNDIDVEITTELNDTVAKIVNKAYGNRIDVHPSQK